MEFKELRTIIIKVSVLPIYCSYLCRNLTWVFWVAMSVQYQCQGCKRMCSIQNLFYCSGCTRLLCSSISCIIREIDYYYCPICLDTLTSSELWKNYYQLHSFVLFLSSCNRCYLCPCCGSQLIAMRKEENAQVSWNCFHCSWNSTSIGLCADSINRLQSSIACFVTCSGYLGDDVYKQPESEQRGGSYLQMHSPRSEHPDISLHPPLHHSVICPRLSRKAFPRGGGGADPKAPSPAQRSCIIGRSPSSPLSSAIQVLRAVSRLLREGFSGHSAEAPDTASPGGLVSVAHSRDSRLGRREARSGIASPASLC